MTQTQTFNCCQRCRFSFCFFSTRTKKLFNRCFGIRFRWFVTITIFCVCLPYFFGSLFSIWIDSEWVRTSEERERKKRLLQSQNPISSIDFAITHTTNVERTALPAPPHCCFVAVVVASFAYSFNLIECVFEIPVIMPENLDYAFNWSSDIDCICHKLQSIRTHTFWRNEKKNSEKTNEKKHVACLQISWSAYMMILDYIFRKGFRSSYLRSFAEKKSLFVVFSIRRKIAYVRIQSFCFSQMGNLRFATVLECVSVCVGIFSFSPNLFRFLLFCRLFDACKRVVYILLFFLLRICFCCAHSWYSRSVPFNILRIVTFWYEKQNAQITFKHTVDNVCMCLELNFLPQMASVHTFNGFIKNSKRTERQNENECLFFWKQMLFKNVNMLEILKSSNGILIQMVLNRFIVIISVAGWIWWASDEPSWYMSG